MRKILSRLHLAQGPRLVELVTLGASTQSLRAKHPLADKRSATRRLTRSTALYAIGQLDTEVRSILESSGLDWEEFQKILGIEQPPTPLPQKDVSLAKDLTAALESFAKQHTDIKMVDLPEVALAIVESTLQHPDAGKLPQRLKRMNVDLQGAVSSLLLLCSPSTETPPEIYISYSTLDKPWKERLLEFMRPHEDARRIRVWHDGLLKPGDRWEEVIGEVRQRVGTAVLLISPNFLKSETIHESDLPPLLERSQEGTLIIMPLVIEPVPWQQEEWLREIQLYPPGGRALLLFSEAEIDEHIEQFAGHVVDVATGGTESTSPSPTSNLHLSEERVPTHLDDPSLVDQLNRRPFAQVMAIRINDVRMLGHDIQTEQPSLSSTMERRSKPVAKTARTADAREGRSFAVHIHGSWGAGKTSVLNFMREQLESGDLGTHWVVVDFNAWRNQRLRPPWWILIRQIYQQSQDRLRGLGDVGTARRLWRRWLMWRLKADWLPPVLTAFLILLVVLFVGGAVNLFDWSGAVTNQASDANPTPTRSDWNTFETALKVVATLLAAWAGVLTLGRSLLFGSSRAAQLYMAISRDPMGPIKRLFKDLISTVEHPVAIFVDDLDRCDGDYLVELLEGIQTLFRDVDVVYVVAADRNWIRASFEKKYEDFVASINEPGRPLGYLFLEKMFQVSASLPQLPPGARETYWKYLLDVKKSVDDQVKKATNEAEREGETLLGDARTPDEMRRVIVRYKDDPVQQLGIKAAAAKRISSRHAEKRTAHFLEPFAHLLEPNPRAMKRLINAYGIRQAVNFLEDGDVNPAALALWTIIELRWPRLADCLTEYPGAVKKVDQKRAPKVQYIPEDIRELIVSDAVRRVVHGEGVVPTIALDVATIQKIVGLSAVESTSGVR